MFYKALILGLASLIYTNANAAIVYQFDFTILTGNISWTVDQYNISLSYSDYVTSTGMTPLETPPLETPLGYSVSYAGTNNQGWWGFSENSSTELTDSSISFTGNAFAFLPDNSIDYLRSQGSYSGIVFGNAPTSFTGNAMLTIIDTSAVPVPPALWLFFSGLVTFYSLRRKPKFDLQNNQWST